MSPSEDQQKQPDCYTPAGRDALYHVWLTNLSRHEPEAVEQQSSSQRRALFERWIRDLLQRGHLDALRPLPSHAFLAEPFHIHTDQVARVIRRLRKERVLPAKRPRMNAGEPEWTERDLYAFDWIADQRAIRYDQLRRLLSRESEFRTKDPDLLSMSRTTQIIKRWVDKGHVIYQPILAKQPGWIWMTRKGIQTFTEEDYRVGAPAPGTLAHLYQINQVRLHLEDEYGEDELTWSSERWLQHQREQMKEKNAQQDHMPDGLVTIRTPQLNTEFEIEVELSRKNDVYLQRLMRGYLYGFSTEPLRYYVGDAAKTTVLTALKKLPGTTCYRPWVEVYSLADFEPLARVAQQDGPHQ